MIQVEIRVGLGPGQKVASRMMIERDHTSLPRDQDQGLIADIDITKSIEVTGQEIGVIEIETEEELQEIEATEMIGMKEVEKEVTEEMTEIGVIGMKEMLEDIGMIEIGKEKEVIEMKGIIVVEDTMVLQMNPEEKTQEKEVQRILVKRS